MPQDTHPAGVQKRDPRQWDETTRSAQTKSDKAAGLANILFTVTYRPSAAGTTGSLPIETRYPFPRRIDPNKTWRLASTRNSSGGPSTRGDPHVHANRYILPCHTSVCWILYSMSDCTMRPCLSLRHRCLRHGPIHPGSQSSFDELRDRELTTHTRRNKMQRLLRHAPNKKSCFSTLDRQTDTVKCDQWRAASSCKANIMKTTRHMPQRRAH